VFTFVLTPEVNQFRTPKKALYRLFWGFVDYKIN